MRSSVGLPPFRAFDVRKCRWRSVASGSASHLRSLTRRTDFTVVVERTDGGGREIIGRGAALGQRSVDQLAHRDRVLQVRSEVDRRHAQLGEAREVRVGSASATLDEVARVAGVSTATVSRALRGLPNVSATTRERVRTAAAELGYVASPSAAQAPVDTTPGTDAAESVVATPQAPAPEVAADLTDAGYPPSLTRPPSSDRLSSSLVTARPSRLLPKRRSSAIEASR